MKQSREWCFSELKVGQRVMIGEYAGTVEKITPLLVLIRTYDNYELNYLLRQKIYFN